MKRAWLMLIGAFLLVGFTDLCFTYGQQSNATTSAPKLQQLDLCAFTDTVSRPLSVDFW